MASPCIRYTAFKNSVTNSGNLNQGIAVIERGAVPSENGTFANQVWAGLASGCYFREAKQGEIAPIWMGRDAHLTKAPERTGISRAARRICPNRWNTFRRLA